MLVANDFSVPSGEKVLNPLRLASAFRRSSTARDNDIVNTENPQRPTILNPPRRTSLSALSLRLTRSNKTNTALRSQSESDENTIGAFFLALPSEIQTQVINYLPVQSVFALRLASRTTDSILNGNPSSIARGALAHGIPYDDRAYVQNLFPSPRPCSDLGYLLQMLRRQAIVDKMLYMIIGYIQMKIYMIRTEPRVTTFGPYRERLIQRLHRGAWTVNHFLDKFRDMLIYSHPRHSDPTSSSSSCSECSQITKDLMSSYPAAEVVPAYQFFQLVFLHLHSSTRAPSYAGTIERRLRGWSRKAPTWDDLVQLMVFGGFEVMSKVNMMSGSYNHRLETVGAFTDKLASAVASPRPAQPPPTSTSSAGIDLRKGSDLPLEHLTANILSSVPRLDDFFDQAWRKRIMAEELVDHERELTSPFGFIQRVMANLEERDGGMADAGEQVNLEAF